MEEEAQENYWPGYVDALSTMTMVLTFVMVILGLAVFILSQNVSRILIDRLVADIGLDIEVGSNPSAEVLAREIREALAEAEEARALSSPEDAPDQTARQAALDPEETLERRVENTDEEPQDRQGAGVSVAFGEAMITLEFDRDIFRIDEVSDTAIAEFTDRNLTGDETIRFEVRAYANAGRGALSEARRIAYYRAMQVRGSLLKGGVRGDQISIRIDDIADANVPESVEVFARRGE
ncbi:MAG: hypothetical protein AAGA88_13290 [Pseudomonadota bacterium]